MPSRVSASPVHAGFIATGDTPAETFVNVLVIYCHPVAESFAAAAHTTVLNALAEAGHGVTDVDLYAEGFDPVMSRQERLD